MAGPGRPGRSRGSGPAASTRGRGRPPGRPRQRRDSNSTVASIDASSIHYVPETSVLKPTKLKVPDDWPCFMLKDAIVYRKTEDGQLQIANICNVYLEGPFIIRGKLETDADEHEQYLRNRDVRSAYIEIAASISYSIGYGPWPVVWAAGRAGWFELSPSTEYAAMYDIIYEGISLYYLVMEVYLKAYESAPKSKKAKLPNVPLDRVLFQYAIAIGDGLTLPDAKQRVQKHAVFLLSHFPKEKEITWRNTSLARWLAKNNEELDSKIRESVKKPDAVKGKLPLAPPPESSPESDTDMKLEPRRHATSQSDDGDVEMEDTRPSKPMQPPRVVTPILPPRPGQVPSAPRAVPLVPPSPNVGAAEPASQLEDPVAFLLELFEEVLEHVGDVTKVKEGTIHSNLYLKCSIKGYNAAKDITHYYAKRLVASLNPKWYDSPFFQWLKARRDEPWSPNLLKEDEVAAQCVRRKKASTANRPRAAVAGKHLPTGPRPSGKNAVLRPGGSSKRPIFADDDDDDDDDDRPSKIAKTSSDDDDSDDEEEIDISSDAAPAAVRYSSTPIPVPVIPKETVRVVVRAEPIPSMSPAGINGTWKCKQEGCNFIVRAAHTPDGQEKVSEHFEEHSARADKINLALAEGTRGHLPINHLLEKIRTLGEASKINAKNDPAEPQYPESIKRRLLI